MKQNERYCFVKRLMESGDRDAAIVKRLRKVGEKSRTIYHTLKCVKEDQVSDRRPGSGKTRSVRKAGLIKRVREKIRYNPRLSGNQMAKDLNVSRGTTQKVIKEDLHLRGYKLQICLQLNN